MTRKDFRLIAWLCVRCKPEWHPSYPPPPLSMIRWRNMILFDVVPHCRASSKTFDQTKFFLTVGLRPDGSIQGEPIASAMEEAAQ